MLTVINIYVFAFISISVGKLNIPLSYGKELVGLGVLHFLPHLPLGSFQILLSINKQLSWELGKPKMHHESELLASYGPLHLCTESVWPVFNIPSWHPSAVRMSEFRGTQVVDSAVMCISVEWMALPDNYATSLNSFSDTKTLLASCKCWRLLLLVKFTRFIALWPTVYYTTHIVLGPVPASICVSARHPGQLDGDLWIVNSDTPDQTLMIINDRWNEA